MTKQHPPRVRIAIVLAMLLGSVLMPALMPGDAHAAAQITARRLTLQQGATYLQGGSRVSVAVNHFFEFTLPGGNSVGSILFLYCTTASGTCTTPAGLDTTTASYGADSGATGFVMGTPAVNGQPYITRTAAAVGTNQAVSYHLNTITNPSATNTTFFVRISTYTSTDTTGTALDAGTVAASTANPIELEGTMPESLVFCTGASITAVGSVPDCSTATTGTIFFNQLFSPIDTATATSMMAASTNAGQGYIITVNGPTLSSGVNTVTAMGATAPGAHGVSQFGLNLKANSTATSTVAIGNEVFPLSNGTNYKGQAVAGYNTADQFKFADGNTVADSSNGGAGGTDAQMFTVSYIVNVPGSQPAGTYTTTLTYICTPTF